MLQNNPNHGAVLAVDLDGTLLRSDMLHESFWSAFSLDWRAPITAVAALSEGRAALKQRLATSADVDVTTLPYDPDIIKYIQDWRAQGGRAALVTASDRELAGRIADHLEVFDEVHGSDGKRNLKGSEKAKFLNETFGVAGYAYMGDAEADVPVWQGARKAITVNVPAALKKRVDDLGAEAEHLRTVTPSIGPYLRAMRPHQWLKNILVFLPMLAAHQLNGLTLLQSVLAFTVFSLVASSVYLLNDLLDLKADRAHPRKCLRPFAAGSIPIAQGGAMFVGLLGLGVFLSLFLGPSFILVMAVYYLTTTAYSLNLKRRVVIDICVLAGLYTLRIVAGAAATGIGMSMWLLAFSIFFFFSLATVKRQAELVDSAASGKLSASGRGYHVEDLPVIAMMGIASGYVSVLVMALYISSPEVVILYSNPLALSGICCVLLYWLTRMVMLTHRGHMHDDPVVFAAKDRISQICVLVMAAFAIGGALL
ncbi:MAG: UbiA family prenyltransferase [Pseudomonadota bacterium]